MYVYIFLFLCFETEFHSSPNWPRTYYVDQVGLGLLNILCQNTLPSSQPTISARSTGTETENRPYKVKKDLIRGECEKLNRFCFVFLIFMYICLCGYILCMCRYPKEVKKRALDPMELELQVVMSHLICRCWQLN